MKTVSLRKDLRVPRDPVIDGEDGAHVVADVVRRTRPPGRVIVVANEKGGVGKSTIAFHLAVALADAGLSILALDLDRRQQTLATVLRNREATARRLGIAMPMPRHLVLNVPSGAMLCQEINRLGWGSDVIVIDVAGFDSGIARRAIALADTLVTPVNSSFVDLDLLAKLNPVSFALEAPGAFTIAVTEIREARRRAGVPDIDWIVAQNRIRRNSSQNQSRIERVITAIAPELGFRTSSGLSDRVAYRELFLLGLSHLDLRRIPSMARARSHASQEILTLLTDLALVGAQA